MPNRDKFLKRKLVQGFPKHCQDFLTPFIDSKVSLEEFLIHVQHQRTVLLQANLHGAVVSNNTKKQELVDSEGATAQVIPDRDSRVSELAERLERMERLYPITSQGNSRSANQSSYQRGTNQTGSYCAYCRTNTHTLAECRNKPPRGYCFDCKEYGCYRGKSTCRRRSNKKPSDTPRPTQTQTQDQTQGLTQLTDTGQTSSATS